VSLEQGLGCLASGAADRAVSLVRTHLDQHGDDPRGWFVLGSCHHRLGDLSQAAAAFAKVIELDPGILEAHIAWAQVTREAGDVAGALAASQRGLARFPHEPRMHLGAALSLEDLGRTEEALRHYEQALAAQPRFEDALHNRGLLLLRTGRVQDAELAFRRYLEIQPKSGRAYDCLADIFLAGGRYEDVIDLRTTIGKAVPEDGPKLIRHGLALACLRRFDEAKATISRALAAYPREATSFAARFGGVDLDAVLSPENVFLSRRYAALGECDWSGWEDYISETRRVAHTPGILLEPAISFMAQHLPLTGVERHGIARRAAARIECRVPPMPRPPVRSRSVFRIGVLSPDFREHLNAYLLRPLFQLADRNRFEMYAYSLAPDDGSLARARLREAADCFRDLNHVSDEDAASIIRQDDIDLLLDVAGHTTGARFGIMAYRPARVQALYLGFSASLASSRVDYAIVDSVIAPRSEEWSESLVRLPHTWFLYDFRDPPSKTSVSRKEYGLPDDHFVYCAFHRPQKISPEAFQLWMRVLTRVARSVLWLLDLPETARQNLRRHAKLHGIDPARLIFAPFEPRDGLRYLARQRLGDLFLDSLHHSAMTTACDAMAGGLPLLTLPGPAMASRGGASLSRAAGLPELVVTDHASYVEKAVLLSTDAQRLKSYRKRLEDRAGPLFDTAGRVRELESAFSDILGKGAKN
jgi:protein O-GlcNAc transferase